MLQVQFIKSQFIFILVWRFLKTITDGMDQFDAAAALVAESGDNLNPFDQGKVAPHLSYLLPAWQSSEASWLCCNWRLPVRVGQAPLVL